MTPPASTEPMYPISESELDQIKNDCLYPERPNCDGCKFADGIDGTRASGLGCNFKGANALMDEVVARGPVARQASTTEREMVAKIKDNLYYAKAEDWISLCYGRVSIDTEIIKIDLSDWNKDVAAQARKDVLDELEQLCKNEWKIADRGREIARTSFAKTGVKQDDAPYKWVCAAMNTVLQMIDTLREMKVPQ